MKKNQQISWEQAKEKIQERENKTVNLEFEIDDGQYLLFKVRGLSRKEVDEFEQMIALEHEEEIKKRRLSRIDMSEDTPISKRAKKYYLTKGVIGAPDGFDIEKDLDELPPSISTELANEIDELTNLSIVLKRKFR